MIKLLRVDHRLLHGQVAFSWTTNLGADVYKRQAEERGRGQKDTGGSDLSGALLL